MSVADTATQRELAAFLGISDRQIRNLEKKGVLGKTGRSYRLGESTRAYIKYIRSNAARDDESDKEGPSLGEEEYRYQKLRNDKLALQIRELERQLASVNLLESALSDVASQIGATLETLPGRLKKRNPSLTDSDLNATRQEVNKLLNVITNINISIDDYYGVSEGD